MGCSILFCLVSLLSLISFPLQASEVPSTVDPTDTKTVVILGGGVGALTSALYLSRAGLDPVILEGASPGGLITQSHSVQNWPGELEISGEDLIEKMRSQVLANGAEFRAEEVIAVDFSKRPFTITTRTVGGFRELHQIRAEACIIAMGTQSNYLGIPGETGSDGYWGRGVSNCAICDGTLYRDRTVGIVGGGDAAVLEGLYLSQIAKEVNIFVRKDSFKAVESKRLDALLARPNVRVFYETTVAEIKGDGNQVTHVKLLTKTEENFLELPIDALFLAIGSRPNSQLFKNILKLDETGYIHLKKDQETSIEGIYAIGDIVDPIYKQAISAASDGAKAAIQAQKYLSDRKNQLIVKKKNRHLPALASSSPKEETSQEVSRVNERLIGAAAPVSLGSIRTQNDVIEIRSNEQFEGELKETQTPVIIDFYAPWCKPCKTVTPLFERSASQFSGKMKFLKVNVDKFSTLSQSYQITAMPTVLVIDAKGSVIDRRVGPDAISELLQSLDTLE